MNQKENKASFVWVILTSLSFGTMEVALKIGGGNFTSEQLTFLRFMIGGLALLPFALSEIRKQKLKLTGSDWLYLFALGTICIFSMILLQVSVMRISANLGAILISINPLFTMIFAHFMTDDCMNRKKAIVLLVCIIGLVIFMDPRTLLNGYDLGGIFIGLAASIIFAFYSVLGKRRIARLGGMVQNSFGFILGALVLLAYLLLRGQPVLQGITLQTIPVVLYLGLVVSGFGYFCYLKAIDESGPSTASIAFFIKPVLALALAAVLLKEEITVLKLAGLVIIVGGFFFNLLAREK